MAQEGQIADLKINLEAGFYYFDAENATVPKLPPYKSNSGYSANSEKKTVF